MLTLHSIISMYFHLNYLSQTVNPIKMSYQSVNEALLHSISTDIKNLELLTSIYVRNLDIEEFIADKILKEKAVNNTNVSSLNTSSSELGNNTSHNRRLYAEGINMTDQNIIFNKQTTAKNKDNPGDLINKTQQKPKIVPNKNIHSKKIKNNDKTSQNRFLENSQNVQEISSNQLSDENFQNNQTDSSNGTENIKNLIFPFNFLDDFGVFSMSQYALNLSLCCNFSPYNTSNPLPLKNSVPPSYFCTFSNLTTCASLADYQYLPQNWTCEFYNQSKNLRLGEIVPNYYVVFDDELKFYFHKAELANDSEIEKIVSANNATFLFFSNYLDRVNRTEISLYMAINIDRLFQTGYIQDVPMNYLLFSYPPQNETYFSQFDTSTFFVNDSQIFAANSSLNVSLKINNKSLFKRTIDFVF